MAATPAGGLCKNQAGRGGRQGLHGRHENADSMKIQQLESCRCHSGLTSWRHQAGDSPQHCVRFVRGHAPGGFSNDQAQRPAFLRQSLPQRIGRRSFFAGGELVGPVAPRERPGRGDGCRRRPRRRDHGQPDDPRRGLHPEFRRAGERGSNGDFVAGRLDVQRDRRRRPDDIYRRHRIQRHGRHLQLWRRRNEPRHGSGVRKRRQRHGNAGSDRHLLHQQHRLDDHRSRDQLFRRAVAHRQQHHPAEDRFPDQLQRDQPHAPAPGPTSTRSTS